MKSIVTLRRFAAAATVVLAGSVLSACLVTPGDPGPADVTFAINTTTSANHAISPLIYGSNSDQGLATNRQTNLRLGGNRWTAYNWENNASNAGQRLLLPERRLPLVVVDSPARPIKPDGRRGHRRRRHGHRHHPDRRLRGRRQATAAATCATPVRTTSRPASSRTCRPRARRFTTTPSTSDGYVYQDEFVNWLKTSRAERARHLLARQRARPLVEHPRRGAPEPGDLRRAGARATSPTPRPSRRCGPTRRGRSARSTTASTAIERLQDAPDAGGRDFIDYYLDQMKAADDGGGHRLVDYLDVHWYPEAHGRRRPHHRQRTPARPRWRPASRRRARSGTRPTSRPAGSPTRRLRLRPHRPDPRVEGQDRRPLPGHQARDHRVELRRRQPTSAAPSPRPTCSASSGARASGSPTYWPLNGDRELHLRGVPRLPELRRRRWRLRRHLGAPPRRATCRSRPSTPACRRRTRRRP